MFYVGKLDENKLNLYYTFDEDHEGGKGMVDSGEFNALMEFVPEQLNFFQNFAAKEEEYKREIEEKNMKIELLEEENNKFMNERTEYKTNIEAQKELTEFQEISKKDQEDKIEAQRKEIEEKNEKIALLESVLADLNAADKKAKEKKEEKKPSNSAFDSGFG